MDNLFFRREFLKATSAAACLTLAQYRHAHADATNSQGKTWTSLLSLDQLNPNAGTCATLDKFATQIDARLKKISDGDISDDDYAEYRAQLTKLLDAAAEQLAKAQEAAKEQKRELYHQFVDAGIDAVMEAAMALAIEFTAAPVVVSVGGLIIVGAAAKYAYMSLIETKPNATGAIIDGGLLIKTHVETSKSMMVGTHLLSEDTDQLGLRWGGRFLSYTKILNSLSKGVGIYRLVGADIKWELAQSCADDAAKEFAKLRKTLTRIEKENEQFKNAHQVCLAYTRSAINAFSEATKANSCQVTGTAPPDIPILKP